MHVAAALVVFVAAVVATANPRGETAFKTALTQRDRHILVINCKKIFKSF